MPARSGYDAFKEFQGKRYTGMKVGRGHKWKYQAGTWSEKKVTPDKWEFSYTVGKQRAGRAPEGSGAPVGTSHRWYIVAEQVVTKLDANNYSTDMKGVKFKVAHKRADKEAWSASDRAQRRAKIQVLKEMIAELEQEPGEPAEPKPVARPRPVRRTRVRSAAGRKAKSAARRRR